MILVSCHANLNLVLIVLLVFFFFLTISQMPNIENGSNSQWRIGIPNTYLLCLIIIQCIQLFSIVQIFYIHVSTKAEWNITSIQTHQEGLLKLLERSYSFPSPLYFLKVWVVNLKGQSIW